MDLALGQRTKRAEGVVLKRASIGGRGVLPE
jgi:hypothetical protein